jgi:polysaccharide biosynthesis transport protein
MNASSNTQVARAANNSVPFTVPGRRPDPLASLRLHPWLALLTGSLLLIAGLAAALILGQHEYETEAQIEVSPTFPSVGQNSVLPFNSDQQYHEFVDQQVAEIDSYATASAALNLLGKDRWLWQGRGESDRRAVQSLVRELEVSPISNTYLISVSLTGNEPEGVAKIVNAVVTAYLQREQHREAEESDQRVKMMVEHRAALGKDIEKLRSRESQIAQALGVSSFGVSAISGSPYDKMLADANEALDSAHRATIEAQAHLDALKAEEQRAQSLEVDSTAEQMVASDPEVNDTRTELSKQRETVFLELQQLGPDHPGRPALEAEMQNINDELARLKSDRVERVSSMLRQQDQTKAQRHLSAAQAQVDQAHLAETGIQQEVAELRTRAASFGAKYREAMAIDANLVRDSAEIQQIDEQIGELRIQTQSAGFVSLESSALTPDMPLKGKRRKIFTIFLAGALVLTIGLPVGLDMIDPLIKTPDELEAIVGFSPFGAMLGGEGRAFREALRHIALGIIRECRASHTRSFVLTPVSEGTISRTLALALAHELNALGIRAAAIESNDFTEKLTNSDNSMGSGEGDHRVEPRAVKSTDHPGLAASGNHPYLGAAANHPPLTSSGSYTHLISSATERESGSYDQEADSELASSGYNATVKARAGKDRYQARAILDSSSPSLAEKHTRLASATAKRDRGRQDSTLTPEPVRGLLDKVRNRYDILLFDAPPILASADAEMLIDMPAGAILVVRSGHDVPRDVTRAVRRLEQIAPPVVGTVMTYVPADQGNHDYSPRAIIKRWLAAR